MSKIRLAALVLAASALAVASCDGDDDDEQYSANLTAAAEIPEPTGSPTATGLASLELDDRELSVNVTVTGTLTSDVVMAHIHGPATTTATAGIILDFVPAMQAVIDAGTRTGTIVSMTYDLDALEVSATGVLRVDAETLINYLNTGQAYVNVHTATNTSGELRGQISRN